MVFEFIIIFVLLFIIFGLVYQFMFDIWIETLVISLVFYISYVTTKLVLYYKQKQPKEEPIALQPETQKIVDPSIKTLKSFITKNIDQGFKPNVIKEALLKQGWPQEKIDQAFKELNL